MKKILIPLLISPPLYAEVETVVQFDKTFVNKDCESTNSCELKNFRIKVQNSKVIFSDMSPSYLTTSFMAYETKSIASLEKFGLVQFIKGCEFTSKADGTILYNIARKYFSETVTFKHQEWVIDSDDLDALYNSNTENSDYPRHALYRWNDVLGSFEQGGEHFYYQAPPSHPQFYVTDRPGTAFFDDDSGEAKNISLQFKSCLFKIEDIPNNTTPTGLKPEQALKCFDWYSAYVYDHEKKKFNRKNEIAKPCL